MKKLLMIALLVTGIFSLGCGHLLAPNVNTEVAELRPGDYQLDPEHSAVLFKVGHMGLSLFVGRFQQVDASLSYDPEHPENARVEVIVDTASINVNNEAFEYSLRGSDWLDVEHFPQAIFRASSIVPAEDNRLIIQGELTFLGVTQPLTVEATYNGGALNLLTQRYTLGFSASAKFQRSQFGLTRFIPAVGDEVQLEIHAEFQRQ